MLSLGRRLGGRALTDEATAEIWGAAASQSVELPQLVTQQVPQGRAANRAAEAGEQEVTTGAGGWREMEGVVCVVALGFHDRRESGFLQNRKYKIKK